MVQKRPVGHKGQGGALAKRSATAPSAAKKHAPERKQQQWSFRAEDDEDVDDDIAFDSDDDAKYGNFFKQQEARASAEKAKAKGKGKAAKAKGPAEDGDELDDEFSKLGATGAKPSDFDDRDFDSEDSREEFDISEMLDSKDERRRARQQRRSTRGEEDKVGKSARAKAPKARMLEEAEGFAASATAHHRSAGASLSDLLMATGGQERPAEAKKRERKATAAPEAILPAGQQQRLQALATSKVLMSREMEPEQKERLDREHVRTASKADLKKWEPFVKEQKKARTLQFPLKQPDQNPVAVTLGGMAHVEQSKAEEKAQKAEAAPGPVAADMATTMNDLLARSGLGTSSDHRKAFAEEQQQKKKSGAPLEGEDFVELGEGEDLTRAQDPSYVGKLKAMLGYEIQRRKRFNRIKSKTYRRILRKEKERDQEKRDRALELVDPEAARRRLQEKMDKLRAEERATQRHKNTSKWVKHVKRLGGKPDDDTKEALDAQHAEHQRLMQKMDEDADAEQRHALSDEGESEEEDRRVDELLSGAPAASVLWAHKGEDDEDAAPKTKFEKAEAELRGMRFMQKAKARQSKDEADRMRELQEDVERHRQGLPPKYVGDVNNSDDEDTAARRARDAAEVDAEDETGLRQAKRQADAKTAKDAAAAAALAAASEAAAKSAAAGSGRKKFLGADVEAGVSALSGQSKKRGRDPTASIEVALPAPEGGIFAESAAALMQQQRDRHSGVRPSEALAAIAARTAGVADEDAAADSEGEEEDAEAEAEAEGEETEAVSAPKAKGERKAKVRRLETDTAAPTAGEETQAPAPKSEAAALQRDQDYLVARAFAKDDVDEDFLKEKEAQVEGIMKPKDKNATLPGWGEWGGEGERLNQRHKAKVSKLELERNVEKSALMRARADRGLDHAIINHDVDLVAGKHQLHMVPRPFGNPKEFERSMRQPQGPEWNTAGSFNTGVAPKLNTKQGVIIDPVDKTSGLRKRKATTRRKTDAKERVADVSTDAAAPELPKRLSARRRR